MWCGEPLQPTSHLKQVHDENLNQGLFSGQMQFAQSPCCRGVKEYTIHVTLAGVSAFICLRFSSKRFVQFLSPCFSHWLQDYLLSLISSQLKEFTDRYTFRHLQEPSAEIHMYTRNKTTNGFWEGRGSEVMVERGNQSLIPKKTALSMEPWSNPIKMHKSLYVPPEPGFDSWNTVSQSRHLCWGAASHCRESCDNFTYNMTKDLCSAWGWGTVAQGEMNQGAWISCHISQYRETDSGACSWSWHSAHVPMCHTIF